MAANKQSQEMNSTMSLGIIQSATEKRQGGEGRAWGGGHMSTIKMFPLKQCRYSPCQGLLLSDPWYIDTTFIQAYWTHWQTLQCPTWISVQHKQRIVRWGPHLKQNFHFVFRLSWVIQNDLPILSLSKGNPAQPVDPNQGRLHEA